MKKHKGKILVVGLIVGAFCAGWYYSNEATQKVKDAKEGLKAKVIETAKKM